MLRRRDDKPLERIAIGPRARCNRIDARADQQKVLLDPGIDIAGLFGLRISERGQHAKADASPSITLRPLAERRELQIIGLDLLGEATVAGGRRGGLAG